MSTELAMLDVGLPAYLKELDLDDTTKALMGGGGSGGMKRISIKGGVWRMMVNGKEIAQREERSMDVVIVAAAPKVSRTFYLKQFSEGSEPVAPDCWSADGEMPDAKASMPQSKRCVDCDKNQPSSGQGTSRACRFSQRLAVVLANDLQGDVFQLTLPAGSIFGSGEPGKWPLQTYAKIIGSKGVPVTAVITEMRFDTSSATPKLTFKPIRVLEPSDHKVVISQGKSDAAIKAITMTVAEADGAKPQAEVKQVSAPVAKPKVETIAETIVETIPEPVKRAAKKDEEQEPKKDLSKILEEWDD
jgi:hypothetical protein